TAPAPSGAPAVVRIPLAKIAKSPWQARRHFGEEELAGLSASIREHGVLQPVLVRRKDDGYELIAGERRFRAAEAAGLAEIPAQIKDTTDEAAMALALIENIQREDLNLIEEAEGYRMLLRDFGLTQEEASARLGKPRATIANALRLLDLSDELKRAVAEGRLSAGHAKVLLGAPEAEREGLARRVMAQGLSVRALERLLAARRAEKRPAPPPPPDPSSAFARQLRALADRIQVELGTKVQLTPARTWSNGRKEAGRMVIEFYDEGDLTRLLETLNLADLAD
ncbi:MAG: ParB/RepB/Spo0J family partition protein, partial [Kiritimatiellae bacterium]|nr:ParB/RepB/Spo0J family partition protein [Kiritimatiellia bacterium]